MVGPFRALGRYFGHAFDSSTVAPRSEYWFMQIWYWILYGFLFMFSSMPIFNSVLIHFKVVQYVDKFYKSLSFKHLLTGAHLYDAPLEELKRMHILGAAKSEVHGSPHSMANAFVILAILLFIIFAVRLTLPFGGMFLLPVMVFLRPQFGLLVVLASIVLLCPNLSLWVRRCHDIGWTSLVLVILNAFIILFSPFCIHPLIHLLGNGFAKYLIIGTQSIFVFFILALFVAHLCICFMSTNNSSEFRPGN